MVGEKKKDFKVLIFRYVIGDFLPLVILFAMLGPIFLKKTLKVSVKIKTSLCFKQHRVRLVFLPTLTIERMASKGFDRFVLFFLNKSW